MDFVIDRSKWRCGGSGPHMQGTGPTKLLNNDGFMCCLGQVCEQLGVKRDKLLTQSSPMRVFDAIKQQELGRNETHFVEKHNGEPRNSDFAFSAMDINDSKHLTDSEREAQLINLFAEHGHTLTFVGSYHEPVHSVPTCVPDRSL